MNPARPPTHQTAIRMLPSNRDGAAYAPGCIMGSWVRAVVHQATMRLDLKERIQRQMFLGKHEPEQTGWFRGCLQPRYAVLDTGARFGYYTAFGRKPTTLQRIPTGNPVETFDLQNTRFRWNGSP